MARLIIAYIFLACLFSCSDTKQNSVFEMDLNSNWKILSSTELSSSPDSISKKNYHAAGWKEGIVPGTILNSLVEAGEYSDIYFGKNLEKIPSSRFDTSWFYRNQFTISENSSNAVLVFEGINYSANVWLNGHQIFTNENFKNAFRQFEYNITDYVNVGENVLLIEVFPPKAGDFSIGFVDWNPAAPDRNMGIFRPIKIKFNGGIRLKNSFAESKLNNDFTEADLFLSTVLVNMHEESISGKLRIRGDQFFIEKNITLNANEEKLIKINPTDFPELKIKNPKLWWPHTVGDPVLNKMSFELVIDNKVSDKEDVVFGIRQFDTYFTPEGHRGIKVNGQKISIRGGGWVDDLTLNDSYESIRSQLEYVKNMNLNTIRLEGFWGKDQKLYDICDELGILVMVGWSCHWEWEGYLGKFCDETYGGILSDEDVKMMSAAWKDQIVWLRNHASIFSWVGGSDCIPKPELEKNYFDIFNQYDSTRVYLASAKEWKSLAGPSGVKMRGPYAYVPPVYWFADTLYGGAFGFNTETGPGAQVPPLESIKKMIPEDKLWPINDVWEYHCGRNSFGTLSRYKNAFDKRYGEPENVEEFAFKAQALNYELMRPMFEAFSINRYKATGLIQWMLNSAWPEMYWQLYDSYLMPNGAFYGAKKAGAPIHAVYNYDNNSLYLVNDKLTDKENISLSIKVFDIESKLIHEKVIAQNISANYAMQVYQLPELKNISKTYFLSLQISENNKVIDDNFYWLSTQKDKLDYNAKVPGWYFHTPSSEFAVFKLLDKLKKSHVEYGVKESEDDFYKIFDIKLQNKSNVIAFFLEAKIVNKDDGFSILPVLWSDNYVSILPGETTDLQAKIKKQFIENKKPEFILTGWNLSD
ncbi:MAG: glycoside hydrolase family 2 TIM barrel-domain containing protein [Bacteroidales bacterium]|nr:glycoside hydrolase family 2 TIM barrel-domain containing protein [Bacteroidales bacterium]